MAHTALNPEELVEYFDTEAKLDKKAKRCAQQIKESKHCIVFTGAGISTSIGIKDFRGVRFLVKAVECFVIKKF